MMRCKGPTVRSNPPGKRSNANKESDIEIISNQISFRNADTNMNNFQEVAGRTNRETKGRESMREQCSGSG